jgi:hypothetical protein
MATEHECGFNAGRADALDGFGHIPEYWGERSEEWLRGYEDGQRAAEDEQ